MGKGLWTALLITTLLSAPFAAAPATAEAAPPGLAPGVTTRVSADSAGTAANGSVAFGSIASGGDYVAFASTATNLVPGVTAGTLQVYRRHRSGAIDLVSIGRTTLASQQSIGSAISADGNIVVFDSSDPNLVDADTNNSLDVFVRDMRTSAVRLVSANAAGEIADHGGVLPRYGGARGISDDGRYVVFTSASTNLVPGPINGFTQAYVKDLNTGEVVRVSVNSDGVAANGTTFAASISGNGRYVVISSAATNFTTPPTNGSGQIYVRDLDHGLTTLESVNNADGLPNLSFGAGAPVISDSGRYVAFETQARLDSRDQDSFTWDVFLRDRTAATTKLVSLSPNTTTFQDSRGPAISADGSAVAFHSVDASIVTGDSNGATDVYLYDRATEGITLVTLNSAGAQATFGGTTPSVSRDGSAVLFASTSTNLVTTPPSTGVQFYVREYATNSVPVVAAGPDGGIAFTDRLFTRVGSFTDPDAGQTWTGTVDYGDVTPPVPLAIAADKTFVLTHVFQYVATFLVQVTVTDSAGVSGRASFLVDVHRTPLIFVPGLFGSVLVTHSAGARDVVDSRGNPRTISYVNNQLLWPVDEDTGRNRPEDVNLLRFTDAGQPVAGDDIGTDGRWVGYEDILPFFQTKGYRLDEDFFVFVYDWRRAVESHVEDFDALVTRVLAVSGSAEVDIVAHSMGTQVTRTYLLRGAHAVSLGHVILVGAPSLGTPEGTYAVTYGECKPHPLLCALDEQLTQYVLRTFPGVVEMGVSPGYYDLFDGRDDAHPVALEERAGLLTTGRRDYAYLHGVMLDHQVPEALIVNASVFHRDDLTWLTGISPRVTLFAGTGHCTMGSIDKRAQLTPLAPFAFASDFLFIDGDETVVRQSASLEDASVGWSHNAGHRVVYRPLDHQELHHNVGLATIWGLLHDDPVSNSAPASFQCTSFSVHSPAEVLLTDGTGKRVGSLDGQTILREVVTAAYQRFDDMKVVTMDAPGAYTAALRGTADGEATIRIRWIDGVVTREAVYRHVPTTAHSVGSLSFNTATVFLGDLVVDVDGNGTPDVTIHPDVLDTASAADRTPPSVGIVSPRSGQAVVGTFGLDWSAVDAGAGVAGSFAIVDRGSAAARTIGAPGAVELPPGSHLIEVFGEDRAGNPATTSRSVIAYAHEWLEPIGSALVFEANEGRTIPGKFRVTTPSGDFVSDASVTVTLVDSTGRVVVGPLWAAAALTDGVVIEQGSPALPHYHANVATKGLGVGSYRIVVSFDSPTLVGQFSVAVTLR